MLDLSKRKLGLGPWTPDHRDLLLSKYVDAKKLIEYSRVPSASDWGSFPTPSGKLPRPDQDPLYNDVAGACFFSMVAHHARMVGQHVGDQSLWPTAEDVGREYQKRTGYDPATGANDTGFVLRTGLKIWMQEGFFGTRTVAYALVGKSAEEKAIANWLGCGTCAGFSLPASAQTQTNPRGRQLWYVPEGGFKAAGDYPGKWGRHGIYRRNASVGLYGGNSWGDDDTAWTPEWDDQCCDENWIVLVDRWVEHSRAPNGFARDDLLLDVQSRTA